MGSPDNYRGIKNLFRQELCSKDIFRLVKRLVVLGPWTKNESEKTKFSCVSRKIKLEILMLICEKNMQKSPPNG